MHTFGDSGLMTGYIKQLLASFNLPTAMIYTREFAEHYQAHREESPEILETSMQATKDTKTFTFVPYIKDGMFQAFDGGHYSKGIDNRYRAFVKPSWRPVRLGTNGEATLTAISTYERGAYIPNYTKTFQIKNNIYDSYTHEYLGDYLRFIRDFDGIDLMPLYNCFSNRILTAQTECNFNFKLDNGTTISFDAGDAKHRIYCLPVRLFQKYTIAIDSAKPVELCCHLFSKNLKPAGTEEVQSLMSLAQSTYVKFGATRFNMPFVYDALKSIIPKPADALRTQDDFKEHNNLRMLLANVLNRSKELYLFIKVAKDVSSSIVVLEGEYKEQYSGLVTKGTSTRFIRNRTVISEELKESGLDVRLITPLQLLRFNTGKQMPFSDRLLEYLLGNCVTGGDETLREDVLMAQFIAELYKSPEIDSDTLSYKLNGVWSAELQKLFYQYMSLKTKDEFLDTLGYVDKDVERCFTAKQLKDKKLVKRTMLSFNLWEDIKK